MLTRVPFPLDSLEALLEYLRTERDVTLTSGGCDNGTQWNRSLDAELICEGDLSYGSDTDRAWPD